MLRCTHQMLRGMQDRYLLRYLSGSGRWPLCHTGAPFTAASFKPSHAVDAEVRLEAVNVDNAACRAALSKPDDTAAGMAFTVEHQAHA